MIYKIQFNNYIKKIIYNTILNLIILLNWINRILKISI